MPSLDSDGFLAPLTRLARRNPVIEALVFWGAEVWPEQPSDVLEAEEIAVYIEGLIPEGFRIHWQIVASPDSPALPDHIRLMIWETGPPPPAHDWPVLDQARWP